MPVDLFALPADLFDSLVAIHNARPHKGQRKIAGDLRALLHSELYRWWQHPPIVDQVCLSDC